MINSKKEDMSMDNRKVWLMVAVYFTVAVLVFLFILFVIKLIWAWTIPDLFPGAVTTGLVARRIGWLTAFKLALFLGILAGVAGVRNTRKRGSWL
jgi:hypothetical protein